MRRIWIITALLALVCFLLSWGGYRLLDRVPTFWVSKITIAGTQRCDQKRIKELTDPAYGQCIFKVNLSDLYQKIRSIGWIKSISISRVMPSTLEIQIQERVPVGIVKADQLYLVDSEGVLIDVIQKKPSASSKRPRASKPSASSKRSGASKRSAADWEAWGHLPLIAGLNLQQGNAPHPALSPDTGAGCQGRGEGDGDGDDPLNYDLGSNPCFAEGCKVDTPCLKSALQAVALMQDMKAQWLTEISEINVEDPDNIILCSKDPRGTAHEIRLGTTDNLREKLMYLQATWSSIKALRRSPMEMMTGKALPPPFQKGVGGTSMGMVGEAPCGRPQMEGSEKSGPAIEYIDLRYKNQLIVKPVTGRG